MNTQSISRHVTLDVAALADPPPPRRPPTFAEDTANRRVFSVVHLAAARQSTTAASPSCAQPATPGGLPTEPAVADVTLSPSASRRAYSSFFAYQGITPYVFGPACLLAVVGFVVAWQLLPADNGGERFGTSLGVAAGSFVAPMAGALCIDFIGYCIHQARGEKVYAATRERERRDAQREEVACNGDEEAA